MKKKMIPLPALVFLIPLLMLFLSGRDAELPALLGLMAAAVIGGMLLGPDMDSAPQISQDAGPGPDAGTQDKGFSKLMLWLWSKRFYEEPAFRDKQIAKLLGGILGVMCVFLVFGYENLILWRLLSVIGGCVAGLLILLIRFLVRRRGRSAVKAPSGDVQEAETSPEETGAEENFAAVVDDGSEEIRRRLEQLEEWRKSGLIGKKEYEELREQCTNRQAAGSP